MRAIVFAVLGLIACSAHARFAVRAAEAESDELRVLAAELTKVRLLEDLADELNKIVDVPVAIGLKLAECGESNAYYDPEAREISMCLELIGDLYGIFEDDYDADDERDDAVAGAFLFFFFHEVGHALVDVLELPITGREEDAVDQLSAWMLIDADEGDKAVIDAATSFYGDDEDAKEIDEAEFADEHGLDRQRYFNMVCWVYGSDPDAHADLVDDEWLPEARAEQCEGEYAQLDRAWSRLMKDHVK